MFRCLIEISFILKVISSIICKLFLTLYSVQYVIVCFGVSRSGANSSVACQTAIFFDYVFHFLPLTFHSSTVITRSHELRI